MTEREPLPTDRNPGKKIGTYYCPLRFQSATIPFRFNGGELEILLVTRSSGKGWTIPKGIIEEPLSPCQSAEEEAWEEAGIRGLVCPEPMGRYHYQKWGGMCHVQVFAMRADTLAERWPEDRVRERKWVRLEQAVSMIGRRNLKAVLVDAAPRIRDVFGSSRAVCPEGEPGSGDP